MHKAQVCGGDFLTTIDRTNWGIDKYVAMGGAIGDAEYSN